MIVLFVLGLLAACGASFYLGVRVAQADFDDVNAEDVIDFLEDGRQLVRARRAGRRLATYWKRRVPPDGLPQSEFREEPKGFERGKGPCRRCGLRAWQLKVTHPDKQKLLCKGCGADHEAWH